MITWVDGSEQAVGTVPGLRWMMMIIIITINMMMMIKQLELCPGSGGR